MPHIILETTADLPENSGIPDILEALCAKLASFETVDSKAIKAYHTLRSVWVMGAGSAPGFAHCTVKILKGRAPELRKKMSAGMYEELKNHFQESLGLKEVLLTLELHEMDSETYHK